MSTTETDEKSYSRVGGWLCLDFTNTVQGYKLSTPTYDYFQDYRDVTSWARQAEVITQEQEAALNQRAEAEPEDAAQALERAREVRFAINRVFSSVANER